MTEPREPTDQLGIGATDMTDRTHPDSGSIISSSDLLLHEAQTALMYEELRAAIDDGHESMTHADALAEIAAIRAENALLRQHAAKQITDATLLTGISPRNGGMDIGLKGGACQLLAEAFFDQFVDAGAVNFLELRFESSSRMPGQAMTVTMQLADGATPGQKIAEANARIAELEAQLEAIGAGGVSGTLMGKPQEMPDLSALTERGAKAWVGVDAQELRGGGADISKEREDFNAWLRTYEEEVGAIDEAAAWAGFSGARASLAASAGSEPVAQLAAERDELFQAAIDFIRTLTGMEPPPIEVAPPEVFAPFHTFVDAVQAITNKRHNPPREGMARPCHVFNVRKTGPRTEWTPTTMALALPDGEHALYTHPSPPEGMVGGWTKASQQLPPCRDDQLYLGINTAGFAGVFNAVADIAGDVHCMYETPEETIDVMSSLDIWQPFTPPTTSAGSGKGE